MAFTSGGFVQKAVAREWGKAEKHGVCETLVAGFLVGGDGERGQMPQSQEKRGRDQPRA